MSALDHLARLRASVRRWNDDEVELALARVNRRLDIEPDLHERLPELRKSFKRWDAERVEAELRSVHWRVQESGRGRWMPALLGAFVAAAAVLWFVSSREPGARDASYAQSRVLSLPRSSAIAAVGSPAAVSGRDLTLKDGSAVRLADGSSRVRVGEDGPTRVRVMLESGRAEFRVQHRAERRFIVTVDGVEIEDLGTEFEVERGHDEVQVKVTEGKVRVSWQSRSVELAAGQQASFPLAEPAREVPATHAPTTAAKPAVPEPTWREAAAERRYKDAFQQLERDGFATVRDVPRDLLLAADVARFSGHPARAVGPLRDLLRRHRGHAQSPAAAFTLGSVLLRDLNRPGEAAVAFEEAQRLAPGGNLAEDATARTAEAWLQAGDRARASAAFERYAARYPNGRHLAFLERLIQSRPP